MFNPGNNTKNADLNPAKYPSLAKNPPKYTTAYIVQQRNCRWHCEPTFLRLGFNNDNLYSHPPSQISPSPISPSVILPLRTLRLGSLSNLIIKTYRIAQQIFVGKSERAGQKVEVFYILYRYGDFTLYFLFRSFAVRERNAGYYEKRPDCIT